MIDTFGREIYYLRLSVTDRCNLRCRYCMPADGICNKKRHEKMLTEDEMVMAVRAAASLGICKLRLTGGFNDGEIPALADLTRRWPVDVRFIELMPMTENETFGKNAYVPDEAVLTALPELVPAPQNDGVARLYRLPGAKGNVGLISAVSNHFCAGCNRIRLTADGKLKPCLHSDQECSIKGLSEEEMRREIEKVILAKPACHAPLSALERSHAGRNMNQIGG